MRVLVISNLYPPYYIGGYELGCRDVVEALRQRGHDVYVLTSTYGVGQVECDSRIYRCLETQFSWSRIDSMFEYWLRMTRKELWNRGMFRKVVALHCPDIVYIWNMSSISLSVILQAQEMGLPVCYYISDNWLNKAPNSDHWFRKQAKPLNKIIKKALNAWIALAGLHVSARDLDLRHVQFTSMYMKQTALQAGKSVSQARIIHWGVDTNIFVFRPVSGRNIRRLLFVGRIVPQKGVHTIIEAFRLLYEEYGRNDFELTIAGGTTTSDYEDQLKQSICSTDFRHMVHFTGLLPRECLPAIYDDHDILLFPSIWDEPFSITLIEAMSSGLVVVGTSTGGSGEILHHEDNALIFPREDARVCAEHILRLADDRDLYDRIRANGRRSVEREFQIKHTVDQIEQHLLGLSES